MEWKDITDRAAASAFWTELFRGMVMAWYRFILTICIKRFNFLCILELLTAHEVLNLYTINHRNTEIYTDLKLSAYVYDFQAHNHDNDKSLSCIIELRISTNPYPHLEQILCIPLDFLREPKHFYLHYADHVFILLLNRIGYSR